MLSSRTNAATSGARADPLRESQESYRLLVEMVVDYAIFLLDPDGYVQTWNRGAERLKGYRKQEIVGRHFSVFYPEEAREADRPGAVLETAARTGRYEEEGWRVRRDGSRFQAHVVVTALRRDGRLVGFAKVTRDLTERKRAEEERDALLSAERTARRQAEEASRAKSDFLAIVSHELRTPLNAIVGYSDLMLDGIPEAITDGHRRQVERVKVAAEYQLQLVEELLTYSRLEAGELAPEAEAVDLRSIARDAVGRIEQRAASQGLTVSLDLPDSPVTVRTDPEKVRQILDALLSNAVKFTPHGSIGMEVDAVGEATLLRVRDRGIGIADADRERIFDSFWQAQQPTIRDVGGMGLGLSIARRLARLLGGEVEVESEPGEGSVFTLRLPPASGGGDRG